MSALRTELCCRRQQSAAFGAGTPERRCAFLADLRSDLILVLTLRTRHRTPEGLKHTAANPAYPHGPCMSASCPAERPGNSCSHPGGGNFSRTARRVTRGNRRGHRNQYHSPLMLTTINPPCTSSPFPAPGCSLLLSGTTWLPSSLRDCPSSPSPIQRVAWAKARCVARSPRAPSKKAAAWRCSI